MDNPKNHELKSHTKHTICLKIGMKCSIKELDSTTCQSGPESFIMMPQSFELSGITKVSCDNLVLIPGSSNTSEKGRWCIHGICATRPE